MGTRIQRGGEELVLDPEKYTIDRVDFKGSSFGVTVLVTVREITTGARFRAELSGDEAKAFVADGIAGEAFRGNAMFTVPQGKRNYRVVLARSISMTNSGPEESEDETGEREIDPEIGD